MSDTKVGEGGGDPEEDWSRYEENEVAWDEIIELRDEVEVLRAELAKTRAQRDATQRALDKANHDNDELRRPVVAPEREQPVVNFKQLVDRGEGDYRWND
jgi:septal ring factor EnvC (AmiA/AmiB activator)